MTARPQVNRQRPGRGRDERDEPPLSGGPRGLERHEADQWALGHVRRERVHDHAEQFRPADALAAQDADHGVVAGGFEVPGLAAARDLQEVVNELRAQGLRAALHLGVAVQLVCVRIGMVSFALQEVEQLDQVSLLRVGAPLAALQIVLAEVLVKERGDRQQ